MFGLGWGVGGEAWKWRQRLLAWEEELVVECVDRLFSVSLQDGVVDRWFWKLHSSQSYSVKSAYSQLTAMGNTLNAGLPIKDNLHKRGVLDTTQLLCATSCGKVEDRDHLFFQCEVYGSIWFQFKVVMIRFGF
ncbi:hypothetical protein TSUD_392130 [Trifolium subterraneum]|uniref:Reverse transcriptase zinc-binding domain-containing protein n=1 Tax=Trifolium subterraneum TaxID=3900 RepID=A0A2Z6N179_TRISU|nr:hypothetical protein TSUD_392130 [Trifolium subterraneum]